LAARPGYLSIVAEAAATLSAMSEQTIPAIPYVALLEGRDPLEVLRATPARLAGVLTQLSPEQAEHKPAPHKWCVREIFAHLADCEIAWTWRLRQAFAEDNPRLQPFDQDRWARAYGNYTLDQAHTTWKALRGWNVAFLSGLTEADKTRPATHAELGPITLWTIAGIAAGHDLHHLRSLKG
jgi:uncharacterized damage-inducible protein DinB